MVERTVRFNVNHGHAQPFSDALQPAYLPNQRTLQVVDGEVHRKAAKVIGIGKAGMGAGGNQICLAELQGLAHGEFIAGVTPAGDVG